MDTAAADVLAMVERNTLSRQGRMGHVYHPELLAQAVEAFADLVLNKKR